MVKRDRPEVPADMVRRIGRVLRALPQCREEPAWVGTRWQVAGNTVAHVFGGEDQLPAHQGKGIGTRVIHHLMAEADASGRPFGLSVEKDNPRALALYERLGLVVVGEDGDEWVMRRG